MAHGANSRDCMRCHTELPFPLRGQIHFKDNFQKLLMSTKPFLLFIVDAVQWFSVYLELNFKNTSASNEEKNLSFWSRFWGRGRFFLNLPFTTQSPSTRLRMLTAYPKLRSISDQLPNVSVYKDSELLQLPISFCCHRRSQWSPETSSNELRISTINHRLVERDTASASRRARTIPPYLHIVDGEPFVDADNSVQDMY